MDLVRQFGALVREKVFYWQRALTRVLGDWLHNWSADDVRTFSQTWVLFKVGPAELNMNDINLFFPLPQIYNHLPTFLPSVLTSLL